MHKRHRRVPTQYEFDYNQHFIVATNNINNLRIKTYKYLIQQNWLNDDVDERRSEGNWNEGKIDEKNMAKGKVPWRFELPSQDSESWVLTATPRDRTFIGVQIVFHWEHPAIHFV